MNTITPNHDFSKSPGQTITHRDCETNNHAPDLQSRQKQNPRSHNHADNHANHEQCSHASLSPLKGRERDLLRLTPDGTPGR